MVLHDLNQASATHYVIAMKNGRIYGEGAPAEVITADSVEEVFGLHCQVVVDPVSGTPLAVPIGRHHATTDAEPAGVER